MRKLGPLALSVVLSASLLVPAAAASAAPDGPAASSSGVTVVPPPVDTADYVYGEGTASREYFVRVAGVPAALNTGAEVGTATATATRDAAGEYQFQAESQATQTYREELAAEQAEVASAGALETVGRELDVLGSYTVANHGFVAEMTPAEARELARLGDVTWIQEMREYFPMTDRGPAWSGAAGEVWERPDVGAATGVTGEGVVVGVIDTGINPSNPAFAETSADGFVHENPRDKFYGSCDPDNDGSRPDPALFPTLPPATSPYDPELAELCNGKLIGMYGYTTQGREGSTLPVGSPIDYNGHGSHTAGTAAGGFADDVEIEVEDGVEIDGNEFDTSGVAPHANIISYAACCNGIALLSSIEQMIIDDIDVLNFSIGSTGPTGDLVNDPITFGFLVAELSGIHIANSAGNQGPGPETVGGPSDAPWLTAVAASTHDRLNANLLTEIVDTASGGAEPLPDILGKGITEGLPSTPIVYAGDFDNPLCLPDEWEDDTFDGEIVICDRGLTGRVDKSVQAAAAGAGGFVLANDEVNAGSVPGSLNGDAFAIPGLSVTFDDGVVLKDWVASAENPTAAVRGTEFQYDDEYGDIVTVFSSRGPNGTDPNILTPHVTAPGMDIIAPYGIDNSDEFQAISGTSMSGPHVAGALALIVDEFADFVDDEGVSLLTPAMARSALLLTARRDVLKTDGETDADAYDVGSGHIDVAAALDTGLFMDEDFAEYLEAFLADTETPSGRDLNQPSMVDTQCVLECEWTRTVTGAPGTGPVTWEASAELDDADITVSPETFELEPGQTQELTITATPDAVDPGVAKFGAVELTTTADVSDAHLPVVIQSEGFAPNDPLLLTSRGFTDDATATFVSSGAPDLQVDAEDLVPGDLSIVEVAQDPTNSDPYNDLDEVVVLDVEVTDDDPFLLADLGETTSLDLDLFVGRYEGEDDVPRLATELCFSAAGGPAERCVIEEPEPGAYWVLIQNWQAGPTGSDEVAVTTVPGEGEPAPLEVEAPASVEPGDEFDVELSWDLEPPSRLWFGSLTLGSDPDNADQLTVPIEIEVVSRVDADAGGPYEAFIGEEITLDAGGSVVPEDMELDDDAYVWDLTSVGVDTPAVGVEPVVTPMVEGDHVITLRINDTDGLTATDQAVVTVANPVTADAGGPYTVELGQPLQLDGTGSSHALDRDLTYEWDLSEVGGREDQPGATPQVTPTGTGEHTITLTVSDAFGAVAEATAEVTVTPVDPGGPGPGPGPGPGEPTPACEGVGPVSFPDMPVDPPHGGNVGCVAGYGIAQGFPDGTYRPANSVRRDQMTSFIARMLTVGGVELPADAPDAFDDDDGGTHEEATNQLAAAGIVEGRGGRTFAPSDAVTRGQMASFIVRALAYATDTELAPAGDNPFTDTAGSPHTDNITVAAELGITEGRTPTSYEPQADVRRDQMGSFIARTLDVMVDQGLTLTPLG